VDDYLMVCLYCAENMPELNEAQRKVFGEQVCCGEAMVRVKTSNLHSVIKSLDKLKTCFERELLKGFGCEQYAGFKEK
jgi:hypothetical protein